MVRVCALPGLEVHNREESLGPGPRAGRGLEVENGHIKVTADE